MGVSWADSCKYGITEMPESTSRAEADYVFRKVGVFFQMIDHAQCDMGEAAGRTFFKLEKLTPNGAFPGRFSHSDCAGRTDGGAGATSDTGVVCFMVGSCYDLVCPPAGGGNGSSALSTAETVAESAENTFLVIHLQTDKTGGGLNGATEDLFEDGAGFGSSGKQELGTGEPAFPDFIRIRGKAFALLQ